MTPLIPSFLDLVVGGQDAVEGEVVVKMAATP